MAVHNLDVKTKEQMEDIQIQKSILLVQERAERNVKEAGEELNAFVKNLNERRGLTLDFKTLINFMPVK